MAARSVREAAEIAAEFMYHHMEETICGEFEDCINPAKDIYMAITGEELDVEGQLGIDEGDFPPSAYD